MIRESSQAERVRYLLRVAKNILVRADAIIQNDTEYLRDELTRLVDNTQVLLEKMDFEQLLLELREELHDRPEETVATASASGADGSDEADGSDGPFASDPPPATGIRACLTD